MIRILVAVGVGSIFCECNDLINFINYRINDSTGLRNVSGRGKVQWSNKSIEDRTQENAKQKIPHSLHADNVEPERQDYEAKNHQKVDITKLLHKYVNDGKGDPHDATDILDTCTSNH